MQNMEPHCSVQGGALYSRVAWLAGCMNWSELDGNTWVGTVPTYLLNKDGNLGSSEPEKKKKERSSICDRLRCECYALRRPEGMVYYLGS